MPFTPSTAWPPNLGPHRAQDVEASSAKLSHVIQPSQVLRFRRLKGREALKSGVVTKHTSIIYIYDAYEKNIHTYIHYIHTYIHIYIYM